MTFFTPNRPLKSAGLLTGFLLFLLAKPFSTAAQCTEMDLNTLQNLQKADPTVKETKILEAGFDLRNGVTQQGQTSKVYSKCWITSIKQQMYFDQKIIWNQSNDTVKFATLNQTHFQNLRKELDARHPSGAGATVVVGKMFKYYLGVEKIDGVDYFTLMLSMK
jgi:hypothetical protein